MRYLLLWLSAFLLFAGFVLWATDVFIGAPMEVLPMWSEEQTAAERLDAYFDAPRVPVETPIWMFWKNAAPKKEISLLASYALLVAGAALILGGLLGRVCQPHSIISFLIGLGFSIVLGIIPFFLSGMFAFCAYLAFATAIMLPATLLSMKCFAAFSLWRRW